MLRIFTSKSSYKHFVINVITGLVNILNRFGRYSVMDKINLKSINLIVTNFRTKIYQKKAKNQWERQRELTSVIKRVKPPQTQKILWELKKKPVSCESENRWTCDVSMTVKRDGAPARRILDARWRGRRKEEGERKRRGRPSALCPPGTNFSFSSNFSQTFDNIKQTLFILLKPFIEFIFLF